MHHSSSHLENFAWQRISQLSNVCCARRGHATCYNSNEHVVFVTGGGTDALGFTQPSFDTFARRIGMGGVVVVDVVVFSCGDIEVYSEVNIGPSFIPAPEDPAITRAPTQAAMTKPKYGIMIIIMIFFFKNCAQSFIIQACS